MDEIIIEQQPDSNSNKHQHSNMSPSSNAGQGLGIVGIVLGALSTMLAFIPCVGILALIPGLIGLSISMVGLVLYAKSIYKGLLIAALVMSVIGTGIAATQALLLTGIAKTAKTFSEPTHVSSVMAKDAGLTAEEILHKYSYETDVYGSLTDESFALLMEELESLYVQAESTLVSLEDGKVLAARNLPDILSKGSTLFLRCDVLEPYFTVEQRDQLRALEGRFESLKTRMMAFGY